VVRVFESIDAFKAVAGEVIGTSDWLQISQERIDTFAEATEDRQWIHVDPQRAADGPFGATIAHGYLTLSLLAAFDPMIYRVEGLAMGVNYGANKVRFPSPVPVDARLRATATLTATQDIAIGTQATITFVVEIEDATKPALVAEVLYVMSPNGDR